MGKGGFRGGGVGSSATQYAEGGIPQFFVGAPGGLGQALSRLQLQSLQFNRTIPFLL